MSADAFRKLFLSSVPLLRAIPGQLPSGHASGCLVDYRGKRMLLTVSHAAKSGEPWTLQCEYVPGQGTMMWNLGPLNYLFQGSLGDGKSLQEVDFAYASLPDTVVPCRQEVDPISGKVTSKAPITIHTTAFDADPVAGDHFGFCGLIKPVQEHHFGQPYVSGDFQVMQNMTFLREEGGYLVFKLPIKHPGHQEFKGCSGAPILNSAGQPVALVCSGNEKTDEILGVSLKAYQVAIDIFIDFG